MDIVTLALAKKALGKITGNKFDATQTYELGQHVIHEGKLYKALDTTTGEWDETKWQLVLVGSELEDLQHQIDTLPTPIVPQGTIAFSQLPVEPIRANIGFMWNISDSFTTDARFKIGAGHEFGAGTNVYVIQDGEDTENCYFDVFTQIDLSGYAEKLYVDTELAKKVDKTSITSETFTFVFSDGTTTTKKLVEEV